MADLVISGMEMPKNGHVVIRIYSDGKVENETTEREIGMAVPIRAGHGRLGDLDKLDDAFTALRFNEDGSLNHWDDRKNWCLHGSEIETILANAPTIVPAEGGSDNG